MYLLCPCSEQGYCHCSDGPRHSVQTEVSKKKMRHNAVYECMSMYVCVCVCVCECTSVYVCTSVCMSVCTWVPPKEHYRSTGSPQGRETQTQSLSRRSHPSLHTMALAVLVNTLSSKSNAQCRTSQITSQGQGREWRDSQRWGASSWVSSGQSFWL